MTPSASAAPQGRQKAARCRVPLREISSRSAAVSAAERLTPRPLGLIMIRSDAAEVQRRAYEICRNRGGVPGDASSDWSQAERELQGRAALGI